MTHQARKDINRAQRIISESFAGGHWLKVEILQTKASIELAFGDPTAAVETINEASTMCREIMGTKSEAYLDAILLGADRLKHDAPEESLQLFRYSYQLAIETRRFELLNSISDEIQTLDHRLLEMNQAA